MTETPNVNRRAFGTALGAAALTLSVPARAQTIPAASTTPSVPFPGDVKPRVGMLVYPDMILLDLVGPLTMFSILGTELHLVWKDLTPVRTDVGIAVPPNSTFADCPADLDVLFVPGGLAGSIHAMDDPAVVGFLADRGARARYVTSVCTGALVLAAAGLLRGYRATTHWYVRDLLPRMGAVSASGRVVVDRNRITAGGVTAGLDFGLTLATVLRGAEAARRVQLVLEYDPHPPLDAGSPGGAGPQLVGDVLEWRKGALVAAAAAVDRASTRLGLN